MNNDVKLPFPIHANVQNIKGPKGDKGEPGEKGADGLNGKDGKDGRDGKDCDCSINFCTTEDILEMFK
jgi:hypothetical protein